MTPTDSFYAIKGIQEGLDPDQSKVLREVHLRMEVDDWYLSEEIVHINQRALFFPAFWKFQQLTPKERQSWFQIAGIHGKPFVAWDEPPQEGLTENSGYCTHNSILFATWHRPYLALWEQVIFELMKEEILKYHEEERAGLLEAAQSWRFPYWDWASKKPLPENPEVFEYNVPLVILQRKVCIRLPAPQMEGNTENAFYEFRMPELMTMGDGELKDADDDPLKNLQITASPGQEPIEGSVPPRYHDFIIPFHECRATSRHAKGEGINVDWQNGKQDNDAVAQSLRDYPAKTTEKERFGNLTASLRDAFYRVLTLDTFEDFATKRFGGMGAKDANSKKKDYAFDSAESLHDNVHIWCGGPATTLDKGIKLLGHMSHVPLAAFDPIFWLHHCNVDRLIAIWQILHDTLWFNNPGDVRNQDVGTFAIGFKHMDGPEDHLRPFHKDAQGNYWTSNDAKEPTYMGYTYPGLEKWKYTKSDGTYDKKTHVEGIIKTMDGKYNAAKAAAIKAMNTKDPGDSTGPELMSMKALIAETKWEAEDVESIDYVVNVLYEKFALNGTTFSIHIFVGKVPDQLPYTFQSGTQVGEVNNFSTEADSMGSSTNGCSNCRFQQVNMTQATGRVILTNALITRWKQQVQHEPEGDGPRLLASMNPEDAIPFLKANLHWKVTSVGSLIPLEDMPSLKVSLAVGKAQHYADPGKLSKFHNYKSAYDVTQDKVGGARSVEDFDLFGDEYTTQM